MNEKHLTTEISKQLGEPERWKRWGTAFLFLAAFSYLLVKLWVLGSMVTISNDAASIWQTIRSFYTENIAPSYLLYKGFASVYPYVWLYQLALIFGVNEFFFVMAYHALLFAYITVIGVPALVKELTGYETWLWQKVALIIVFYWYWNRWYALSQLVVDLPSCAFFLLSIQCAAGISRSSGYRQYGLAAATGLLCGLCANISGQYSVAALCVMIFAAVKLWNGQPLFFGRKKPAGFLVSAGLLFVAMASVKFLNNQFYATVVQPLLDAGHNIAPAKSWMERGMIYMLDIGRLFYGPQLYDDRGHQIIMSLYGVEEGTRLLQLAEAGRYGWRIPDYFRAFFQHPIDFLVIYLNRLIVMISDDCGNSSLRSLLPGYTMIYLSFLTGIRHIKGLRDFFCLKLWLVLAVFATVIPLFVLTVEPRYTLSLQALLFGVALAGPIVPRIIGSTAKTIRQLQEEKISCLLDKPFPWALLGWVVFCAGCLAYFGAICAASNMGTSLLYHW